MKMYLLSLPLLLFVVISGCTKEESVPVKADFDVIVVNNDYSVPCNIIVKNKSVGADQYEWFFSGGSPESSTKENPGEIRYSEGMTHEITLKAFNKDGQQQVCNKEVKLDDSVSIDFELEVIESLYPPVKVVIKNKSLGLRDFNWLFTNGIRQTSSTKEHPDTIVFHFPGDAIVRLEASNGRENHQLEKQLKIEDSLAVDFSWEVDFLDDDMEVPVTIRLNNLSSGILSCFWEFTGTQTVGISEVHPWITFTEPGEQKITLRISNGKKSKTIEKTIQLKEDRNLRAMENVKLGINTSHANLGAFYSCKWRRTIMRDSVQENIGKDIDIVYLGLNDKFNYNRFISPLKVQDYVFEAIPNAKHTIFVNSQELVGEQLSVVEFDELNEGAQLQAIIIEETDAGQKEFTSEQLPRIVLFQTGDGRKGAIKVKAFVKEVATPHILCDIKVQKKVQN